MNLTEAVTVTVDKGDILGVLLLAPVAAVALWALLVVISTAAVGGNKITWGDVGALVTITLVGSGAGWVLWWVAHWFTRG